VKIDIPKILLELRREVVETRSKDAHTFLERKAFALYSWFMRRPGLYSLAGRMGSRLARVPGATRFGPAAKWGKVREIPLPAKKSFRAQWRDRKAAR
jgi:L-lactate dehydrogenase complex protein LldF